MIYPANDIFIKTGLAVQTLHTKNTPITAHFRENSSVAMLAKFFLPHRTIEAHTHNILCGMTDDSFSDRPKISDKTHNFVK